MITRTITLSYLPDPMIVRFFSAPLQLTGRLKSSIIEQGTVKLVGEFPSEENYCSYLMAIFLVLKGLKI